MAYLVERCGFDAAFNYRGVDLDEALRAHCPQGIDLYFDNVGGATLEAALTENAAWTKALGTPLADRRRAAAWRKSARVVAAYRDRYRITDDAPIGAPPESAAQKIDAARARSALDKVRQLGADESRHAEAGLQPVRRDLPGPGRSI